MRSRLLVAACATAFAVVGTAHAEDPGEMRLRCSVPSDAPLFTRSPGGVAAVVAGRTAVVHSGQALPEVMVDGWRPAPARLGAMLSGLGAAAGFKVVAPDALPQVSWSGAAAPLTEVVDALAAQAGASWTYSSGTLTVSRSSATMRTSASIALPSSRDTALALLDTLRGLDAKSVEIHGESITFSASPDVLSRIRSTLSGISQIFVFDVAFLEVAPPAGGFAWKASGGVSSGSSYVVFGEDADKAIASLLGSSAAEPKADGAQTVSGPAGWALVVPESQCGTGGSEVVLKPRRNGDGFDLDIQGGGFSSSVPSISIGQTAVVASAFKDGVRTRIITIRPRIVSVK